MSMRVVIGRLPTADKLSQQLDGRKASTVAARPPPVHEL